MGANECHHLALFGLRFAKLSALAWGNSRIRDALAGVRSALGRALPGAEFSAAAGRLRTHIYLSEAREKSFGWNSAGIWTLQVSIHLAICTHLFTAEAMAIPCWIRNHRSRLGHDLDCGSRLEGCGGLHSPPLGYRK